MGFSRNQPLSLLFGRQGAGLSVLPSEPEGGYFGHCRCGADWYGATISRANWWPYFFS